MDPIYPYGRCWLAVPLEVYVELLSLPSSRSCQILSQIAYWLSSYPLGKSATVLLLADSSYTLPRDVVKSRVQLRTVPPKGTPVQYIASELKAVVKESGV